MTSRPPPSKNASYVVGYGKPPVATRFGNRPQPDRKKAVQPRGDIIALLDRPERVERAGKQVSVHPLEAELISLANAVFKKRRVSAAKKFLQHCQRADLLRPPPGRRTSGVLIVPRTRYPIFDLMLKRGLLPPWGPEVTASAEAEYESDLRIVSKLAAEYLGGEGHE